VSATGPSSASRIAAALIWAAGRASWYPPWSPRVEVTSPLASWPHNPGSPNYYISLGFITSIAAGSPLKGWRLVYGSQTFPIMSYADQIGYTLPASVSIDLVELLPAP